MKDPTPLTPQTDITLPFGDFPTGATIMDVEATGNAINTVISGQKAIPDGLASLDSSGKLDDSQKPIYTAEEVGAASASDLTEAMASVAQTYQPKGDYLSAEDRAGSIVVPVSAGSTSVNLVLDASSSGVGGYENIAYQSWVGQNFGQVKSVNNEFPDLSTGDVTIDVGVTSVNSQTGEVDIFGDEIRAVFKRVAGNNSLWIDGSTNSSATGAIGSVGVGVGTLLNSYTIAVGNSAKASGQFSTALGQETTSGPARSIAIGASAVIPTNASAHSIQLGQGTNSSPVPTLQVWGWPLLDKNTGLIPAERLPNAGSSSGFTFLDYDKEDLSETQVVDVTSFDSHSIFSSGPGSTAWMVDITCGAPEKAGEKKTIAILPLTEDGTDERHQISLSFSLQNARIFKGEWDGSPISEKLILIEMESAYTNYSRDQVNNSEPPSLGWVVTVNIQPL